MKEKKSSTKPHSATKRKKQRERHAFDFTLSYYCIVFGGLYFSLGEGVARLEGKRLHFERKENELLVNKSELVSRNPWPGWSPWHV